MRIAHIALWTRDLEGVVSFWTKYFEAKAGPLYESSRRAGFVSRFLKLADGVTIEVMTGPWLNEPPGADDERPGWAHLAVSVGSEARVRDLAERLSAAGLLVSGPRWTGDGFYEAVIRDPDGNLIEITV